MSTGKCSAHSNVQGRITPPSHAELEAIASLIACSKAAVLEVALLESPRSPDMNTIRTAAYAAVAAKMLSLLAEVVVATPNANTMMKTNKMPNLAASSATKYRARIEPTRRVAARETLSTRVVIVTHLSLKILVLSSSCSDLYCKTGQLFRTLISDLHVEHTFIDHMVGKLSLRKLVIESFSDETLRATRSCFFGSCFFGPCFFGSGR